MTNIKSKQMDIEILLNKKLNGSVTVEAAFSFTLTIFILFLMIGPLLIIKTSSDLIIKMNDISKDRCIYELIREKGSETEIGNKISKYVKDNEDLINIGSKVTNFLTYELMTLDTMNSYGDSEQEYRNVDYISDFNSKVYDENLGVVKYDYEVKFKLPYNLLHINGITKRFVNYRRAFIGADGNRFDNEIEDGDFVFITKNSKDSDVYHDSLDCSYFTKDTIEFKYSDNKNVTNDLGEKLTKCEYCFKNVKPKNNMVCYKTETGNRFHSTVTCAVMTGIAIKVTKEEVEEKGMHLCYRCANRREE